MAASYQTTLQDTYITIYNADGYEWMNKLKEQIAENKLYGNGYYKNLEKGYNSAPSETTSLMV